MRGASHAVRRLLGEPPGRPRGRQWLIVAGLALLALALHGLYAVDLAPRLYSHRQPGTRMTARYDDAACAILAGEGVLFPARWPSREETSLLARPPGYPLFVAGVYRLLGRSYYAVQLVQGLLLALVPVLVVLLACRLVSFAAAALAGAFAALSPHLGYSTAVLLADGLSTLPVLLALWILALGRPWAEPGPALRPAVAAGALLGLATWLRPNVILLAPFLGLVLLVLRPGRRALKAAILLAASAGALVAPITLRNALVYGAFVPVSINGGLTLWEGVAAAGGQEFGAKSGDKGVMWEEARRYGKQSYGDWWASPEGIRRDRDRYHRALAVIAAHPVWYLEAMAGRVVQMLDYAADAPPVAAQGVRTWTPTPKRPADPAALRPRVPGRVYLAPGWALEPARPALRVIQIATSRPMRMAVLAGSLLLLVADWRRATFLLATPLYYLGLQSFFIFEWRVVAPMHPFLFVAAGAAWTCAAVAGLRGARRGAARLSALRAGRSSTPRTARRDGS